MGFKVGSLGVRSLQVLGFTVFRHVVEWKVFSFGGGGGGSLFSGRVWAA